MAIRGVVIDLTQDTLTDAGTVNMVLDSSFTGNYTLALSFLATKDTGTAAGTAKLQQSVNGSAYSDISGLSDLTITDVATQTIVWSITSTPAVKYRVNIVGAGTQSTTLDASYIFK